MLHHGACGYASSVIDIHIQVGGRKRCWRREGIIYESSASYRVSDEYLGVVTQYWQMGEFCLNIQNITKLGAIT